MTTISLLAGQQPYGCSPYGGSGNSAVSLISSSPVDGTTVAPTVSPVSFVLDSQDDVVASSLIVTLAGQLAILEGVFQPGFAGSVVKTGTRCKVTIFRPGVAAYTTYRVDCNIIVTDLACNVSNITFTFFTLRAGMGTTFAAQAKTYCGGKQIGLIWLPPTTAKQMIIRRSGYAFCQYLTDPGENIYSGIVQGEYTDAGLEENKFYYYTLFFADQAVAPFTYYTTEDYQVEGLSIKDYKARFGDYVYALLPKRIRQADAESSRGADQFLMKKYCDVMQCGVNLYRGWMEALLKFRDPDEMPSGRLDVASNQKGLLEAQVADFGVPPERTFDAAVLRRIVSSIITVYKQKGTCPGLTSLIKLFAGWDSRCDEVMDPICGSNRIFAPWDGESYFVDVVGETHPVAAAAGIIRHAAGYSLIDPAGLPAGHTLVGEEVTAAYDSCGSYACVSQLSTPLLIRVDYSDPTMLFYGEYLVSGACVGNVFTVNVVTSGPTTLFGHNAFAGYKFMADDGTKFDIVSSTMTLVGGQFTITLNANTPQLAGSIALDFLGVAWATRRPVSRMRFIVRQLSMIYDALWDARLLFTESMAYWTPITAMGAAHIAYPTFSPSDVILWVTGNYYTKGNVSTITATTLTAAGAPGWAVNHWAGYYVIPNWNSPRLYKIVSNTASVLTVDTSGDLSLVAVTIAHATFIILSEEQAIKYQRLVKLMPNFAPHETRCFIKFEGTSLWP